MNWIDLRSDTVTQPSPAMREVMLHAQVGDDVYGEDPSVNALEARLAAELGFEAAVFVASGTQSNLLALLSHCERGDEYIVGMEAHTYKYEGGGAAVLGSIQPQPIINEADGSIALDKIHAAIKPDDPHFARTRLLCLENTWHGRALALEYLDMVQKFCRTQKLQLHLDGARLFNAAVALQVPAKTITRNFDSVSVCLSKGLGAPVGSVLLGNKSLIHKARRWKKVTGGGWRQAGMLAAACSYALDHHITRLVDDHRRAQHLGNALQNLPGLEVLAAPTNMVFIRFSAERLEAFKLHMHSQKIRLSIGYLPSIRLVTHLDIDDAAIDRTIIAFSKFFQ